MRWASAVSDRGVLEEAVDEVISQVQSGLQGETPDLAVVFVSPHHAEGFEQVPELLLERLGEPVLIGCSGGGIIGGFAWLLSAGDYQVMYAVITPAVRGDYVVTPAHLRGERELEFIGRDPNY